ncbi:MAG TPA: hypothetical protein VEK38_00760 [Candidatus Bathyarchaeia archaeon]|nr:hypothetical protein [Candidatus Bathyarchaeia archaeon]
MFELSKAFYGQNAMQALITRQKLGEKYVSIEKNLEEKQQALLQHTKTDSSLVLSIKQDKQALKELKDQIKIQENSARHFLNTFLFLEPNDRTPQLTPQQLFDFGRLKEGSHLMDHSLDNPSSQIFNNISQQFEACVRQKKARSTDKASYALCNACSNVYRTYYKYNNKHLLHKMINILTEGDQLAQELQTNGNFISYKSRFHYNIISEILLFSARHKK